MTKEEAIVEIIKLIYDSNAETVVTDKEISLVNQYYKDNYSKKATYKDFLYGSAEVTGILSRLQSGKYEIEKQFKQQKALQAGILVECVLAQSLAQLLSLKHCVDLDTTAINLIPVRCIQCIKASAKYISSARYIYYGADEDKFIVQYGNPDAGDAEIIYFDNHIKLEFKDSAAKAGEYDLELDEAGKLFIPEKKMERIGHLQWFVDGFNATNSIFDLLGHNDKNFDTTPEMLDAIITYFNKSNVDLLITSINNQLVAIRPRDMKIVVGGKTIISTSGSEIRTTGRNKYAVFTPIAFRRLLEEDGAIFDEDGSVLMPLYPEGYDYNTEKLAYGNIQSRGKEKGVSHEYKLRYMFCVPLDKIAKDEDQEIVSFNIKDVLEKKPTVSPHMAVAATRNELKELYELIL